MTDRVSRHAFDGLAVLTLLAWGARTFPSDVAVLRGRLGSSTDHYLFGPDAAEWAGSALALFQGRYEDLDFHRMPTFTLVTAALMSLGLPVTDAMHLWNRVSFWLLPVVLYALGARSGSRAAGFGAGLALAVVPKLVETVRAAGVDPTVLFFLPTMLLVASVTASRWWLAPLGGVVTALAAVAHFTTVPFVVPALVLTLLSGGRSWRRWAALLLHAGGAAATGWVIFRVFPLPDKHQVGQVIQEGVQRGTVVGPALSRWDVVTDKMRAEYGSALSDAASGMLPVVSPSALPVALLSTLLVLGALGLFLRPWPTDEDLPGAGAGRWLRALNASREGAIGFALLLCLAPLPVLAMFDAPERYSYNLIPLVLLLVWRGVASVLGAVDVGVGRLWSRWPVGVLTLVAAGAWAGVYQKEHEVELQWRPPPADAVAAAEIGDRLAAHFPPGGGASIPLREAGIGAARKFCPHSDCPRNQSEEELRRCMIVLDTECGGEGPIPYVVLSGPNPALSRPNRAWLDAFVLRHWPVLEHVDAGQYKADIVAIPREEARKLAEGHETPKPDEFSVPPPPDPQRPPGPP